MRLALSVPQCSALPKGEACVSCSPRPTRNAQLHLSALLSSLNGFGLQTTLGHQHPSSGKNSSTPSNRTGVTWSILKHSRPAGYKMSASGNGGVAFYGEAPVRELRSNLLAGIPGS